MKKLAIIGTGMSGLGAAYFLRDRFDLTLYEKNNYAGGHTNTVTFTEGGQERPVDTGFMVYNEVTYPNLTRLFRELDVETKPTDMSFSVQYGPAGLEYNGSSLDHLFAQRRNLLNPRFWRMLIQINRFNSEAVSALEAVDSVDITLREYVKQRHYGDDFLNLYLVPMAGAVWSSSPERMLEFPASTLLRFWHNHGFLGLNTQHPWRTVVDGARSYVTKIRGLLGDRVRFGAPIRRVRRKLGESTVELQEDDGEWRVYDKVVIACHGDQAIALLDDPTAMESDLLSKFRYQSNATVLHTDSSVMPRSRKCWASWNYRVEGVEDGSLAHTTHYWMNRLQHVSEKQDYFVSLNAECRISPEKILRRIQYEHPIFDLEAVAAQKRLPMLNQVGASQTTYYCGAWFKYGFHEDGLSSALA